MRRELSFGAGLAAVANTAEYLRRRHRSSLFTSNTLLPSSIVPMMPTEMIHRDSRCHAIGATHSKDRTFPALITKPAKLSLCFTLGSIVGTSTLDLMEQDWLESHLADVRQFNY